MIKPIIDQAASSHGTGLRRRGKFHVAVNSFDVTHIDDIHKDWRVKV
jgi:hypothetical protein